MRRHRGNQTQTDSNVRLFVVKGLGDGLGGCGVKEIKLPQKCFLVHPFETDGHCWRVVLVRSVCQ